LIGFNEGNGVALILYVESNFYGEKMNGDLERMVYNGTMDLATYQWWQDVTQQIGWAIGSVGIIIFIYVILLYFKKGDDD